MQSGSVKNEIRQQTQLTCRIILVNSSKNITDKKTILHYKNICVSDEMNHSL